MKKLIIILFILFLSVITNAETYKKFDMYFERTDEFTIIAWDNNDPLVMYYDLYLYHLVTKEMILIELDIPQTPDELTTIYSFINRRTGPVIAKVRGKLLKGPCDAPGNLCSDFASSDDIIYALVKNEETEELEPGKWMLYYYFPPPSDPIIIIEDSETGSNVNH